MVWPALAYAGWVASRDGAAALRAAAGRAALVAGVGMFTAYALVLAALQRAPRQRSRRCASRASWWRRCWRRPWRGGGPTRAPCWAPRWWRAGWRWWRWHDPPVSKQVSIARLRELGITPNRELGQNFLIDDNVLGMIGSAAPLRDGDVVLEVGPGLGVLTRWLAERIRWCMRSRSTAGCSRRWRSRWRAWTTCGCCSPMPCASTSRRSSPPPAAMVANLPYSVATPVIMDALPVCERFCVMVQREIADRLFAAPASKAYGAVSVLVQLSCARLAMRPVSRNVFTPVPRVDSALVAFERRSAIVAGPDWPRLSQVVHAAFAHRRKRLGNSLRAGRHGGARRSGRAAGRAAGAGAVPGAAVILTAPAKINLCLRVGPLRDDGFHRLATAVRGDRPARHDRAAPGPGTSVEGFAGHADARVPWRRWARRGGCWLDKRIPVGGRPGRRLVRRGRGAARAARAPAGGRAVRDRPHRWAPTCRSSCPAWRWRWAPGAGTCCSHCPSSRAASACCWCRRSERLSDGRRLRARAQPNEIFEAVRGDLIRGVHTVRSAADVAALVANDLEPAAIELCPGIADALARCARRGALAAAVSGSGPTVFGIFGDRAAAEAAAGSVPGSIADRARVEFGHGRMEPLNRPGHPRAEAAPAQPGRLAARRTASASPWWSDSSRRRLPGTSASG